MIKPPNTAEILDSLICAVLVTDTHLNLKYLNLTAEELLSHTLARVKGRNISSIIESEEIENQIKQALNENQYHVTREARIKILGNGSITVDCAVSPCTRGTQIVGVLIEIHQVDRQKRIARENRILKTLDTNQSVLRGMAHEIKNPLGGLRGAAQLLEIEHADESVREYTRIIISEADRLSKLVDNMLGPAKLAQKNSVNIHEIVEHAKRLVNINIPNTLLIKTDYDPSIPELMADRDQLIQVILNIINNAVKSIGSNIGEITLRTRVIRHFTILKMNHPLVLNLEIIDNGPGIPENLQDKIFYPMITGYADGTGLGLSIAQSLINQHNGLIEFDSKPGNTRFSIIIPLETTDDSN